MPVHTPSLRLYFSAALGGLAVLFAVLLSGQEAAPKPLPVTAGEDSSAEARQEEVLAKPEPGDIPYNTQPFASEEAARTMTVPDGFTVQLFAAEPMVRQPIAFSIDDRGRIWVAEAYNYPFRDRPPQDRILILEDTNGDGQADKRTVFYNKLGYVTGLEVGFGGIWVMSPPEMLFIPDRDQDDRPDAEPEVLLDGFGNTTSSHNIANGFNWGPDGWLYAGHGRTSPSDVGPPGTPKDQRIHFDGGVFRYHPTRKIFESFCDGTTNPWGVAFDDYGQAFVCNCVTPHLYHCIQGGHYEPWRGRASSQYAFERLDTIADHLHWVGEKWEGSRSGEDAQLAAGGGHAHCGTMVYLGDSWPEKYRNTVFMGNIHGRRINNDILTRRGSSYTASHGPDVMLAADPWFKPITVQYGPEGAMYVSDWSDTGECHDYKNTQRQTGRIFTLQYGEVKPWQGDIANLSNDELVKLQLHANDWFVQHARRVLQERAATGADMVVVHEQLRRVLREEPEVPRRLRALWALFVTGGTDEAFLQELLADQSEYVRAWSVRLLSDAPSVSDKTIKLWETLAASDASPFVRLHLASAVLQLPLEQRWGIVAQLIQQADDAADPFLPLMVWYGLEPLIPEDPERALNFLHTTKIDKLRPFMARRAASGEGNQERLELLSQMLATTSSADVQRDILDGAYAALEGRSDLKVPVAWPEAYTKLMGTADSAVRQFAPKVGLLLGDESAARTLRARVRDQEYAVEQRIAALQTLLSRKTNTNAELLLELLADQALRGPAIRGLAGFDQPEAAATILQSYVELSAAEKQDALATLASRAPYARALLEAVESQEIPRGDFTAATVRQLQQLPDADLKKRVAALWSTIGGNSKEIQAQIKQLKTQLTPIALREADLSHGRELFVRTCAACHRLFGEGGKIGPEITGANRGNLDYLLENIVDPNALVSKDYQLTVISTADGRTLPGLLLEENQITVKLQLQNEEVVIPVEDIEMRKLTPVSMMPVGILRTLSEQDIRDLIGYLASPQQVPLPQAAR